MSQRQYPAEKAGDRDAVDERFGEAVSALMDGEARELELRQLLAGERREAVNQCWQRFQLTREVMHKDRSTRGVRHLDISQQIQEALAGEALPRRMPHPAWLKPVAGFAVAASVALGLVVGLQGVNQTMPGTPAPAASNASSTVASNRVYPLAGSSMQAAAGDRSQTATTATYRTGALPGAMAASSAAAEREAQQRLDKYLLRHTENAVLNNSQGVISFARVTSFEAE